MSFDLAKVRADFPILTRKLRGADGKNRPLCYLDHGATTHAPQPVLDAVTEFCSTNYAAVHRGNHTLSQEASQAFEDAVATLGAFVGADAELQPVVLGHNTTSSLDLASHLMSGTRGATLTTLAEHHSNDLPHRRRGKTLHAEIDEDGRILLDDIETRLGGRTKIKLLAVTGASNVTGIMPPIHKLARLAHDHGARILVDAAQLYAHAPIDVKSPDHPEHIDLLAAAGHKSYAPFGSSFLVAPQELLDTAPPYMPGGGTVKWVTKDDVLFADGPDRHQGGTPNVVGAVAFAAATRYLESIGMDNVRSHEEALTRLALRRFAELESDGVALLGPRGAAATSDKVGVFAFLMDGYKHPEISQELDQRFGIATRNGCFCAHPLLHRLLKLGDAAEWTKAVSRGEAVELPGATRATLGLYNREADVELLASSLRTLARERAGKKGPRSAPRKEQPIEVS